MDFSGWLALQEMTDVLGDSLDDVRLEKTGHGTAYWFTVDDEGYKVTFKKYVSHTYAGGRGWTIDLEGPNDYNVTNRGRAPTVYRQLIKAVRKFIGEERPDIISFIGAESSQNVMYKTFYEKFLKGDFLKVNRSEYFNRVFIEKIKAEQPDVYKELMDDAERVAQNDPMDMERARKIADRQKAIVIMKTVSSYVGKIVTDGYRVLYIVSADMRGTKGMDSLGHVLPVYPDYLRPLGPSLNPEKYAELESLERRLKSSGVRFEYLGQRPTNGAEVQRPNERPNGWGAV